MITVNCSQCRAQLEMDDAFAGGVCRCHYCGTIQAVPANAKRRAAAPAPGAPAPVGAGGTGARGDGLDALADAVAGSGLNRGALRSAPGAPAAQQPIDYARPPKKRTMLPLLVALGVILLLLGVAGLLFVARKVVVSGPGVATPLPVPSPGGPTTPGTPGGSGDGGNPAPVVVPKTPNFCGIDLQGVPSVVYVLDRGRSTEELFDTLKEATYRSLESLKPGQKFQIVFWDNADPPAAYPKEGLADVSPQEIAAAQAAFSDLVAGGRAKADGAVRRAAKSDPAAIVLVTGKAYEADDALAKAVQQAVKGRPTKVHTVALRSDDGNTILKKIADQTQGQYRVVTGKELREFSY